MVGLFFYSISMLTLASAIAFLIAFAITFSGGLLSLLEGRFAFVLA